MISTVKATIQPKTNLSSRDFVSWSQLSTFRQCPLKYRFRYLDHIEPEFTSSSLLVGSSIHSAIELYHRRQLEGCLTPSLDELLQEFWDSWKCRTEESLEVRFGKNEDVNSIHELAGRMLTAFLESEVASEDLGTIIGVEETLVADILSGTDLPFLGIVDLVIKMPDRVVVRDYKTSRSRWSQANAESSADQLTLYGELIRQLIPGKPIGFEFVAISKTKSPNVDLFEVEARCQAEGADHQGRRLNAKRHRDQSLLSEQVTDELFVVPVSQCLFRLEGIVIPGAPATAGAAGLFFSTSMLVEFDFLGLPLT